MKRLLLFVCAFCLFTLTYTQAQTCSGMSLGRGASLNGFLPFPADNAWNQDISSAPVDPNSTNIINFIGSSTPLHPDFGAGLYEGQSIGIPYDIVSGSPFVNIKYTAYGSESDPGPLPVPQNAPIEGYPHPGNGDRHVLILDRDNCWLYELYSSYPQKNGSWDAGSGTVWDLLNDEQRPYTWTSADAAGLSVFAGLARYDEVASGEIKHALLRLREQVREPLLTALTIIMAALMFIVVPVHAAGIIHTQTLGFGVMLVFTIGDLREGRIFDGDGYTSRDSLQRSAESGIVCGGGIAGTGYNWWQFSLAAAIVLGVFGSVAIVGWRTVLRPMFRRRPAGGGDAASDAPAQ